MKKRVFLQVLESVCRLGLGALFIYSAFAKISDPDEFAYSVSRHEMLPDFTIGLFSLTMPMLERPVFDQECLPEKAGALKAILYTWMYCYRKFEYAVDPLRRGFLAWVRLFLSIQVFIVLPVAVSIGLILGFAYCVIILTKKTCEVAEATLDLTISMLLLALGLLGIVVVVYLIYLVLAMVFQWKVRLPRFIGGGAPP